MIIYTVIMSLLTAMVGFLLMKHPPEERDSMLGYRTRKSGSSQEAWDYAQQLAGRNLIIIGIFNLVFFTAFSLVFGDSNSEHYVRVVTFVLFAQVALLLLVIPIVEVKLGKYIKNINK